MHVAKTIKALFLLTNHLIAAYTPSETTLPSQRVHRGTASDLDISQPESVLGREARFPLVDRQAGDGESCERKARCKKNRIRDPSDPTKCIKCPPLMKSDPTKTVCIRDKDVSEEDKKKTYKDKIKEKIKEKFEKFKDMIKERLEKKKEEKNTEWDEKDKQRRSERNQKKFRRMAVCLPLTAAAIGTEAMLEMADGGFSLDLLDSINGDMLEVWPGSDIDDDWLDNALPDDESDIVQEDFAKGFLEVGDAAAENAKRSMEKRDGTTDINSTDINSTNINSTDINSTNINSTNINFTNINSTSPQESPSTEKRNFINAIANLFRSAVDAVISVAKAISRTVGAAARATKFFSNGRKPNLKQPGESKWSRAQQLDKAKEISKNKNWTRCLRGEKAEK
ncbi:uncharacterized protein J4E78_003225 [Alternaria triticimaculans]|uniref:uncharacterized protein n=1 Tax=Alternaria triticimaculans TaxID=297637 RepID=UPI0020C1D496|nr:uncharacterized protein J4E78_003225 [Alternaria triticimaculans]KAI4665760.1 hypothetical protein J4E78_003225 [Alternaria triticimaculans]